MPALSRQDTVRAKFHQQKTIQGLSRPLESSGSFLYSKNHGVCWRTKRPFPFDFVVIEAGIIRRDGDAQETFYRKDQDPVIEGVSNIFLSLFRSRFDEMDDAFDLYHLEQGSNWQVGLKAKHAELAKFVNRMVLSGNKHITEILIYSGNDKTRVRFSGVSSQPVMLTEEEQRRFRPTG